MVDVPLSAMPPSTSPQLASSTSPSQPQQQQPTSSSSSSSSSSSNIEDARRQKRKEQNRLAQRRHREKARFELKRQRLDNHHDGARNGDDDGEGQDELLNDQHQSTSSAPRHSTSSSASHDDAISPTAGSSQRNSRISIALAPSNANDGRMLAPVRLATGNADADRRRNESFDAASSNGVRQDMYPGSSRNGSTSSQSQSQQQQQHTLTQLLPNLATSSSSSTAQALSRLAQQHVQNGDEESFRDFVALTALSIPWANRLLKPRWDLMKVLHLATQRLGLTFDYVEEDSSISFLALDFENASGKALTMGQGLGGASGQGGSSSMEMASTLRWHVVPDNMQPSTLCGAVPHHPFVDLSFPWPVVRDKILAAATCGLLNEHTLCVDIWPGDSYQESGAEPPYWVHGDDAFDPEAYEVSDRFARKYPWLLDASIIRRTNWWRRQQGKAELPPDTVRISQSFAPLLSAQMSRLLETAVSPSSRSALLSNSPFANGGSSSRFAPVNDETMLGAAGEGGGGGGATGVEGMEANPQTSESMKMESIGVPILPPMSLPTSIGGALPCHLDDSHRQTFHDSMPFLTGPAGAAASGNGHTASGGNNGDALQNFAFSPSVS